MADQPTQGPLGLNTLRRDTLEAHIPKSQGNAVPKLTPGTKEHYKADQDLSLMGQHHQLMQDPKRVANALALHQQRQQETAVTHNPRAPHAQLHVKR